MKFKLFSKNKPAGDQPKAIEALVLGLRKNLSHQTLLGVTGSGKTFTIANVIAEVNRPTLVIAHNKTLAAQLCNEFRELFPKNAVHYFVSYYDYYQPEAYLPTTDTYIGKEAMINEEIDRLRHAATSALLERKDVLIVASVSCIYGLGAPEVYRENILHFRLGNRINSRELTRKLINLQFKRTSSDLRRGTFRLRGDNWEIMPPNKEIIYSFYLKNGIIAEIFKINPVEGFLVGKTLVLKEFSIAPARHFITLAESREIALSNIRQELEERIKYFESQGKYLEAERIERRTKADLIMLREIGYCNGIENYSRHLSGRLPGSSPATLLNYFPDGFLTVIDESHVTIPQLRGMYEGDASRKKQLIDYGFRLPSAADNRPLKFEEFEERINQVIYTSATPGLYELARSEQIAEQIIRPTGLVDPAVIVRPVRDQINDLILRIKERARAGERTLVTALTKRMAEDLSDYLNDLKIKHDDGFSAKKGRVGKIKVAYLHSDIKTLDRIKILTDLRRGNFDVLVGVNLLREGLDLPEVSLVAILDADKEGFLRSETSLIQIIGRAARNVRGEVLIYADEITGSIKRAIAETERRRQIQLDHNKKHNIIPRTVVKDISNILPVQEILKLEVKPLPKSKSAILKFIAEKEKEMKQAAESLNFELAAVLRDEIKILNNQKLKKSRTKIKN